MQEGRKEETNKQINKLKERNNEEIKKREYKIKW